jgi:hypothetical protein
MPRIPAASGQVQALRVVLQALLRAEAFDRVARQKRRGFHQPQVALPGTGRIAVVHGEGSHRSARGIANRDAPTGLQTEAQRQLLGYGPAVIRRDILDHDGLVAERGRAAGTDVGPDFEPMHDPHVLLRQASAGPAQKVTFLVVQQQDGAQALRRKPLNAVGQRVENLLQRGSLGHQLQHAALFFDHPRGGLQRLAFTLALLQSPQGSPPAQRAECRRTGAGHRGRCFEGEEHNILSAINGEAITATERE